MLGDQLKTDILGANSFGIDSALALTGLSRWEDTPSESKIVPTYLVEDLFL
ncbi:MAG: HAD hydrolase-like protein [Bradymonadaceae bacterium]